MTLQHDASPRFHQSWFLRVCLGLYAVTALLIFFIGRGTFTTFILVFSLIVYVGAPLFLSSLLFFGLARYRRKGSWILYAERGLILSLCLVALMLPLSGAERVAKYDVARAKAFCESLLPELNEIKALTGAYPSDISELASYTKAPWLLRHHDVYSSDSESFIFNINEPGAIMGGWALRNSEQIWQYWD